MIIWYQKDPKERLASLDSAALRALLVDIQGVLKFIGASCRVTLGTDRPLLLVNQRAKLGSISRHRLVFEANVDRMTFSLLRDETDLFGLPDPDRS